MSQHKTVLITGAKGLVGTSLRKHLARPGRTLRLVDIAEIEDLGPGEEFCKASFVDMGQMEAACRNVDAIVDLARFEIGEKHTDETWGLVTEVNIRGAYTMFEAARRQCVKRFVYASSNHTVGFYPVTNELIKEYLSPLPDTYYGVMKVLGEALGSLYYNRFGMDVVCIRIGSQFEKPLDVRMLSTWLSPADAGRVFEAAISTPNPGFRIVWGMSANTRSPFSREEGSAIGYEPQDNAEDYAAELVERFGEIDPASPILRNVGGASAVVSSEKAVRE